MKLTLPLLFTMALGASALELNPSNWEETTADKLVFLKFFAPWCGHCKKMKPDWDKLMAEYKDNEKVVVAEVDCTAAGKPLCDQNGVKGFPTIKHGDPNSLEDYKGGRDYASFAKQAADLKPSCSASNIDLCDDETKAKIEELKALGKDGLDEKIKAAEEKIEGLESDFKAEVEKLQQKYQELMTAKDEGIEEVKNDGLSLMKSVKTVLAKAEKEEL